MPIQPPSVHLQATIKSSAESATGLSAKSDAVDIALLHAMPGGAVTRDLYRVSATATQAGLLLVSLRKVLDDGSTVLLYRHDEGRELNTNESEADWGRLAPKPQTVPIKGRR